MHITAIFLDNGYIEAASGSQMKGMMNVDNGRKEAARKRKSLLQRERRDAEKSSSKRKRNDERIERYDAEKRRDVYIEKKKLDKIDEDAQRYRSYVDDYLTFEVCCVCAFEGPGVDFVALDDVMDYFEESKYTKSFVDYCVKLSHGTSCDKLFCLALKAELNDLGLLKDFDKVCDECYRQMKSKKKSRTKSSVDEAESDNESDETSEDENDAELENLSKPELICPRLYPGMPEGALFAGLFQGAIPVQLEGLTMVEHSMISLYSNLTRITVQAGVHYTVVNDLTSVMTQLPNFADVNSFAILRHRTSQKVKQYQFRPKRVKDAVQWLISNNPLYADVICALPTDIDWSSEVEFDLDNLDDIMLNDEEYEELNGSIGADIGGATPSTNTGARDGENEVLLMLPESLDDSETCALFEAAHGKPVVDRRNHHEFVDPFNKPSFYWERLFPTLFPYGRGGPSDPGNKCCHHISGFAKRMLNRGGTLHGRRFQQSCSFIFTAYAFDARKRIGGVSFIASKFASESKDSVTVNDVRNVIDYVNEQEGAVTCGADYVKNGPETTARVKKLLKILTPFSKELDGSASYFSMWRKKLFSMLTSNVILSDGNWRLFSTFSGAETYDPHLFYIANNVHFVSDKDEEYASLVERVDRLNKVDRIAVLRKHPALSCRLHKLRQTGIWDHVILGESQPFGEVVDYWRRSEFQEKGTPHDHCLVAVKIDSIKQSDITNIEDAEAQMRVKKYVQSIITCKLQPNVIHGGIDHDDENVAEEGDKKSFMWNPLRTKRFEFDGSVRREFFPDKFDPRRNFFPHSKYCKYKLSCGDVEVPLMSFKMKKNGNFHDLITQHAYRKWQIANQMHDCTFTCWKFCKWWENKICRFMYPVEQALCSPCDVTINVSRDRRHRIRVRALAPRNNGHLNNCPVSPLLAIAHGGNIDVQYIHSPYGAAEYCSSYCSKPEAPDLQTLQNMFVKKLSKILLRRDDISFGDQSIAVHSQCNLRLHQDKYSSCVLHVVEVEVCRVIKKSGIAESTSTFKNDKAGSFQLQ